jgi:hypothetical protein
MTTLAEQKEKIRNCIIPDRGMSLVDLCSSVGYVHSQVYDLIINVLLTTDDFGEVSYIKQQYGIAKHHKTCFLDSRQAHIVLLAIERIVDFKTKRLKEKYK